MDPNTHHNALDLNAKLHWYEIKSILGQGGFGITYLAYDTNLKQQVAIKEYLPVEFSTRDAADTVQPISASHSKIFNWGLKRFLEEAQTLAGFKHPNIVRVHSFFEHNNTAYIVMDYENGVDLSSMIRKGEHFSEERLLNLMLPIIDGLEVVHKSGFIHRDIKPANIFIRNDGSPVLLDFGSARHAISGQTKTMTSLVTPGYAPFEQYHEAEGKQGPWTDIYSLGATCYCVLTGKPPPEALKRGMAQFEHNTDVYLELSDIKAGKYSEAILESIDWALRFREADRPQSVTEWKRMITDGAAVPKPQERTQPDDDFPITEDLSKAPDKAKRPLWPIFRTLIILGLLGAGGSYLYTNQEAIKQQIDDYIEGITARQLEAQQKAEQARQQELKRQEELKKQQEVEAKAKAAEQVKLAQQRREQRKKELEAELAELELLSGEGQAKKKQTEQELKSLETQRLAEQTAIEQQQAALKLEREQLEVEKQGLAQQKLQTEEAEKIKEAKRQQDAEAKQDSDKKREAELKKQKSELAKIAKEKEEQTALVEAEKEKRKQAELARKIAEGQNIEGLTFEEAILKLQEELSKQVGTGGQTIDQSVLAEIVRQQLEKLQARDAARLQKEKQANSKQLLQTAEEQFTYDNYEKSLDSFRQVYDINAGPGDRGIAIKGILDTMAKLYEQGNSKDWKIFKGSRNGNFNGRYVGALKWDSEDNQAVPRWGTYLVMHKGNQLTLATPQNAGGLAPTTQVIVVTLSNNGGTFDLHDLDRNRSTTGIFDERLKPDSFVFNWRDKDGTTGSWHGTNHETAWLIDVTGKYMAKITNGNRRIFPGNEFIVNLFDGSGFHDAYPTFNIQGSSEDGLIELTGKKSSVRQISFEFLSKIRGTDGSGKWLINDKSSIEGTWKTSPGSDNGTWTMTKIE
jgi:serine/threonine protein kinase